MAEALGHNYSPASCTTPRKCTRCGETSGSALGHIKGPAATCTTAQKCTRCEEVIQAALGHNPGKEATCVTPQRCTRCDIVLAKATGKHIAKSEATCTTASVCKICGVKISDALDHNYSPASCTAPRKCTRCGETSGSALGHSKGPSATCTTAQKCTRCGEIIQAALGHTNGPAATCTSDQICTKCGIVVKAKTGHSYSSTPTSYNSNANGHTAVYKCQNCTETKTDAQAAHTVDTWNDNGNNTHSGTCEVCDYTVTKTHNYDSNDKCIDCGATTQTGCEHNWVIKNNSTEHWEECSECNITKDDSIATHNVSRWIDEGDGTHSGTCTTCNYKQTFSHSFSGNTCTKCGATQTTVCEHDWGMKSNINEHWEECNKCSITKDGSLGNHNVVTWADKGNGAHEGTCITCNYKVTRTHNYGDDDKCIDCGATKQIECEHNWTMKNDSTKHWQECSKCNITKEESIENHVMTWIDKGDGTHEGTCIVCNYEITKIHNYGDNNKCTDCGVTKPEEVCEHSWITKNNLTEHWQECAKCNMTKLGSLKSHNVTSWINKKNGTHAGTCTVCTYMVTAPHDFTSGICAECYAKEEEEQECNHEWNIKANENKHWQECTKCGITKDNSNENHNIKIWTDNGDGTHTGTCTVCSYEITENHSNGTSKNCDKCNYIVKENDGNNSGNQDGNNNGNQGGNNNGNQSGNNNGNQGGNNNGNQSGNNNGNQTGNNNENQAGNNNANNTNSGKTLPNTGKKTVIISVIGLTTLFGTSIVGIKKYKDIV